MHQITLGRVFGFVRNAQILCFHTFFLISNGKTPLAISVLRIGTRLAIRIMVKSSHKYWYYHKKGHTKSFDFVCPFKFFFRITGCRLAYYRINVSVSAINGQKLPCHLLSLFRQALNLYMMKAPGLAVLIPPYLIEEL